MQKLPAQADFRIVEGAVNQLCEEPRLTSPPLRKIFRNHRLDLQSRVLQNLVDAAVRRVRNGGCRSPGPWSEYHGWSSCIHRLMQKQGWTCTSPWQWQHAVTGAQVSILANQRLDLDKIRHDLREGFRANMFEAWKKTSRNDAACCREVPYSTFRCKRARDMAAQAVERSSFMSGAFRSPAADAIARQQDPTCPFCAQDVGSTDHILWHCAAVSGMRPHPKPEDALQARLAWPSGRRDDEDILSWACHVRRFVLRHRYEQ